MKWVFLLMFLVSTAEAAQLLTYPEPTVNWDKNNNNKIIHDSVCDNYLKGSLPYRACRRKAKLVFKERCQTYKMKYDRSTALKRKTLETNKDMYCYSARNFRI